MANQIPAQRRERSIEYINFWTPGSSRSCRGPKQVSMLKRPTPRRNIARPSRPHPANTSMKISPWQARVERRSQTTEGVDGVLVRRDPPPPSAGDSTSPLPHEAPLTSDNVSASCPRPLGRAICTLRASCSHIRRRETPLHASNDKDSNSERRWLRLFP